MRAAEAEHGWFAVGTELHSCSRGAEFGQGPCSAAGMWDAELTWGCVQVAHGEPEQQFMQQSVMHLHLYWQSG